MPKHFECAANLNCAARILVIDAGHDKSYCQHIRAEGVRVDIIIIAAKEAGMRLTDKK